MLTYHSVYLSDGCRQATARFSGQCHLSCDALFCCDRVGSLAILITVSEQFKLRLSHAPLVLTEATTESSMNSRDETTRSKCPHCGKICKVRLSSIGKQAECPECRNQFDLRQHTRPVSSQETERSNSPPPKPTEVLRQAAPASNPSEPPPVIDVGQINVRTKKASGASPARNVRWVILALVCTVGGYLAGRQQVKPNLGIAISDTDQGMLQESSENLIFNVVEKDSSHRPTIKNAYQTEQRPRATTDPSVKVLVGRIVGVTDGDTVTLLDDNKTQHKIRLKHIDTPESNQDFGSQAKKALSNKVFNRLARVEWTEKDRYGRTLGDIFIDDRWINKELITDGYAWHYRQYSDNQDLAAAENAARRLKVGLWSHTNPIPPWDFRRGVRAETTVDNPDSETSTTLTVYRTRSGTKYHRSGCRYLSKSKIPISLEEAKRSYGPCSVCKPPR